MRTNALSFSLAFLLHASVCTPPPRASRTESAGYFPSCTYSSPSPESSRTAGRVSTVQDAVRVQKRRGSTAKYPTGSGSAISRRWFQWQELAGSARVVRLDPGCGRTTNRLATLSDGSRACVRYGVDQDQVLGETLCFHLATLLGINNVLPLALAKPDPFSEQWSAVRDSIEALNWSSEAIVSLTQWVPSATRVHIPIRLRRVTGVRPVSWYLENTGDLKELLQWTDLVLFDYLTANFDRIASHLFSLQWDKCAMDRLANNLLRTPEGHLVFIDNEAGLIHGYRVLEHWEHLHRILLNSTCMFREGTVQLLMELKHSRSVAQCLHEVYQAREPFAQELGFLSKAQIVTLQNRVDVLYSHFQECITAT